MKIHALILLLCGITALFTTFHLVKISKLDSSIEDCPTCQSSCDSLACNTSLSSTDISNNEITIDTSSFKFTDNALSITANVKTNLQQKFNCGDLIVNENVLGNGAVCSLDGKESKLIIDLGTEPSIIKMGGLSVRKHFSSSLIDIATVKWGTKRKTVSYLTVSLKADETHIYKNKGSSIVNLEASSTTSTRLDFTWKVVDAPSLDVLDVLKETLSTISSNTISLSVSNLEIGVYTIQVTVRNSRSESASSTVSFEVIDGVPPIITIQNQNSLQFIIGNLYIISPQVSFPKEYKGTGKLSNLNFTYSLVKGPSPLTIKQKGELLVLSNDYTHIPTDGEYIFKLTVQEEGVPDGNVTFKVTAKRIVFET